MTASENSSSLNQGLDQWPLPGNRYFRFGSVAALQRVTKRHQAVTGQELPVTYVWWTDCFKQTTDIVPPN